MTGATVMLTVEGVHLPGRSCAPDDADARYENVHVGLQRRQEPVELVPGDAAAAQWTFPVTFTHIEGGVDVTGEHVHGRRGDRFVYLTWGVVEGDRFTMFRRAKLHFADAGDETLVAAEQAGALRCRVHLTDACGLPRCARVRPPDATWSAT